MKSDLDTLMRDRNFDAILIFGDAEGNPPMYYFVGDRHVSGAVLLKKSNEAPVLFYHDMERDEAARSGLKTRPLSEFGWGELMKQTNNDTLMAGALRMQKILEEYGLTDGRIGIYGKVDFSSAFGLVMNLMKLLPEVEFVGESGMDSILLRAMETKDELEVARIRQMGAVTTTVRPTAKRPMPAMPASEIGESMTRPAPNSFTRPDSTLKGVPASATSSPMMNTVGSRRISSASASLIAWANVSSRIWPGDFAVAFIA